MSSSPITVRVVPSLPVHVCCDKESSRYALGAVQVIPVRKVEDKVSGTGVHGAPAPTVRQAVNQVYAVATDSRCLAVTKLEGLAVDTALCPHDMVKPAPTKRGKPRKTVELNGRWESNIGTVAPVEESRFPRCDDVIPRTYQGATVVRLDARFLAKLAEVLANDEERGLDLLIPTGDDYGTPIGVNGINGFGLIMPLSMEKQGYGKYTRTEYDMDCRDVIHTFESKVREYRENNDSRLDDTERKELALAALNPEPVEV